MRNLCIVIFLSLAPGVFSQYYPREFGVRGGYTAGLAFRVNIEEDLSYEAQLSYRNQGAIFTMFRQNHKELGMDQYGNWEFIYGMGVHFGFYFTDSYRIFLREIHYQQNLFTPVMGVDGYMGVDYRLEYVPLSFGISFQPHMEVSLRQIFAVNLWDFGVHVKYRF
jgi:hypothetical protein